MTAINQSLTTPKAGYIKIHNPTALLDRVQLLIEQSDEWKVYNRDIDGYDHGMAVIFLNRIFSITDLGFTLYLFGDRPKELQMDISAVSWGEGRHFPTIAEYEYVEKKAWSLIRDAGKSMGLQLRLSHHLTRPNPLRGRLKEAFDRFIHVSTSLWTGKRNTHFDIRDEIIWHDFIRLAHQYCSVITPEDLSFHFRHAGFSDEFIKEVTSHYIIGRRVLSRKEYPWEERKRLKELRKINKEKYKREKEKILSDSNKYNRQ